ncbi:MAG: 2Fe-2S iron-sulfur cluster binding domain-containing protein [Methyloprofundus sp.]|nr:2Fe-2S iron-sulfur cluster binding domain-containing protein [Methyloprofundus sp.]
MPAFVMNQQICRHDFPAGMLLLDFLRTEQQLASTKQACREGDCGACLVLVGQLQNGLMYYRAVNSCLLPLGLLAGQHIVTIEGVNKGSDLNFVQQTLVEQGAIQCGFCTPGLVMAITAFLLHAPEFTADLAIDAVSGNLCRCTGYAGIQRAIQQICQPLDLSLSKPATRIQDLITQNVLPAYFADIPQQLVSLPEQNTTFNLNVSPNTIKVAGGTDLFVQQPAQLISQPLGFIEQADSIQVEQQRCIISASTHTETLRTSIVLQGMFPSIIDDFKLICSSAIRQQATLAGNLVNASPIGDLSVFFLALDAELMLCSATAQRNIALRHFFQDYKQVDLHEGELIKQLSFACPEQTSLLSFEKVSKRQHLDIASVNSAMSLVVADKVIRQAHIAVGGVAAIPLYLAKTSAFLQDKEISIGLFEQALKLAQAEITPLSDVRGSAAYKRLLVQQLFITHWLKLLPDYVTWQDFQ